LKKGRKRFLFEKKNQKLLSVTCGTKLAHLHRMLDAISKSFLLLFFKKEVFLLIPDMIP